MAEQNPTQEHIPFDERVDILFKELELAIRWEKPSILLVVYGSAFMGAKAMAALESKLSSIGQTITHLTPEPGANLDVISAIWKNWKWEETVFFSMNLGFEMDGPSLYEAINPNKDFFIDNPLRLVYWLTQNDFAEMVKSAPENWDFRHRIVEFTDDIQQDYVLSYLVEKTWQNIDEGVEPNGKSCSTDYLGALKQTSSDGEKSQIASTRLLLTLAMLHWRQGNYSSASGFITAALEIAQGIKNDQFLAECYIAFALVNTDLHKYEEAIEAYEKAIQLPPFFRMPWNNLGNLYVKLFMFDKAIEAYQKALEANNSDPISLCGLGECYLKLNQIDNAIEAFEASTDTEPNLATSWDGLGKAYTAADRINDAIEAFSKALEIDHRRIGTWLEKGRLEELSNQYELALDTYTHILELDQTRSDIWNLTGNIHFKTKAYDEAIKAYFQAIQLEPNSGWYYANMALVYAQKGEYAEASVLYQKSLLIFDNSFDIANTLIKLGYLYRNQGLHALSVQAFRRAEQVEPGSTSFNRYHLLPGPFELRPIEYPEVNEQVASETEAYSEPQHIFSMLEPVTGGEDIWPVSHTALHDATDNYPAHSYETPAVVKVSPPVPDKKSRNVKYWGDLGNFYMGTGMYEQAIGAYQTALELEPRNGWTFSNLAMVYTLRGEYKEAIPLLERSIELLENNQDKAIAWNRLGSVYRRLNDRRQATYAYQKAKTLGAHLPAITSRAQNILLSNCLFE